MATELAEFEDDPRLFLFTSLTAGSSHIITATSRLETILKANKIPFQAIDTATDEKARKLWQRRAQKKKLPGLVKDGFVIGDLEEVEEWNEFGELKENIGPVPANTAPPGGKQGINIRPVEPGSMKPTSPNPDVSPPTSSTSPPRAVDSLQTIALPGAAEIAALNKAKTASKSVDKAPAVESITSAPEDKDAAKEISKNHPALEHLSAPASAIQSGAATPHHEPESATNPASPPTTTSQDAPRRHHRGSEVRDAPPEEIKRLEDESALKEEDEEDEEDDMPTKGVQRLRFSEPEKPQDQDTEEAGDAEKSAGD